jgi:hypothetical protein
MPIFFFQAPNYLNLISFLCIFLTSKFIFFPIFKKKKWWLDFSTITNKKDLAYHHFGSKNLIFMFRRSSVFCPIFHFFEHWKKNRHHSFSFSPIFPRISRINFQIQRCGKFKSSYTSTSIKFYPDFSPICPNNCLNFSGQITSGQVSPMLLN